MDRFTLYITHKNYSSWSLRIWLLMRVFGIDFIEKNVPMTDAGEIPDMRGILATSKVPCLIAHLPDGDLAIPESLAIAEFLAEIFTDLRLWPGDISARAKARALAAEMHAGFGALRNACPMNLRRPAAPLDVNDAVRADVRRIEGMWQACFDDPASGGGPFLMGDFSIVDAMYAPVYSRLQTYQLSNHPALDRFGAALTALPAWQEWTDGALQDKTIIMADEL